MHSSIGQLQISEWSSDMQLYIETVELIGAHVNMERRAPTKNSRFWNYNAPTASTANNNDTIFCIRKIALKIFYYFVCFLLVPTVLSYQWYSLRGKNKNKIRIKNLLKLFLAEKNLLTFQFTSKLFSTPKVFFFYFGSNYIAMSYLRSRIFLQGI